MSPEFSTAIDPIFLQVIDVLDRIGRNQAETVDTERDRIDRSFRNAEAQLGERPEWLFAKYALVAWTDESLKAAPWDGARWWKENSLEFAYFNTNDAAVEFYVKAKEAAQKPKRDALEVFYVCVVLGFRGLYDLDERAFLSDHLKISPDVGDWARAAADAIQLRQGRSRLQDTSRPIHGAPPLEGRTQVLSTAFWLVFLLMLLAVLAYYLDLFQDLFLATSLLS